MKYVRQYQYVHTTRPSGFTNDAAPELRKPTPDKVLDLHRRMSVETTLVGCLDKSAFALLMCEFDAVMSNCLVEYVLPRG